ncbi:molecular chaperone TorD [Amphritea sp. HPY]|uniref:molecular chaperone TorD n=1 Tax=Amphritea sp. HPY TaxID=3421652 RepID=UPI003D7CF1E8
MQIDSQETEARASIYWWLSTVFAKELTTDQLNTYFDKPGLLFMDALSDALPGAAEHPSITRLKNALAGLQLNPHPQLELAADFAQQFLADKRSSALPYASIYLSPEGLLYQQPHEEMLALLTKEQLVVVEEFREPADHLAIMLDYLGNQVLKLLQTNKEEEYRELLYQQLNFIEERLLSWIPEFRLRSRQIKGCGFYPAVADYLLSYLESEKAYLTGILDKE